MQPAGIGGYLSVGIVGDTIAPRRRHPRRESSVSTPASAALSVLIDDTRSFRDNRPCRVARTSAQGVALLTSLHRTRIDALWLDHDLGGDDDIWPVIRVLEDAALRGQPLDVRMVHVQAARSGPAHRMLISLRRTGYAATRSSDLRMWSMVRT